eukprot:ANDGO_00213.mRNA.1 hypothetical protein
MYKSTIDDTWDFMSREAQLLFDQRRLNRFLFRYILRHIHQSEITAVPLRDLITTDYTSPDLDMPSGVQTRSQARQRRTTMMFTERLDGLVDDYILSPSSVYQERDEVDKQEFSGFLDERQLQFRKLCKHVKPDYSMTKKRKAVWNKISSMLYIVFMITFIPGLAVRMYGLSS